MITSWSYLVRRRFGKNPIAPVSTDVITGSTWSREFGRRSADWAWFGNLCLNMQSNCSYDNDRFHWKYYLLVPG